MTQLYMKETEHSNLKDIPEEIKLETLKKMSYGIGNTSYCRKEVRQVFSWSMFISGVKPINSNFRKLINEDAKMKVKLLEHNRKYAHMCKDIFSRLYKLSYM